MHGHMNVKLTSISPEKLQVSYLFDTFHMVTDEKW